MELIIIVGYIVVAVLGLVLGSFAGATVWRLRAGQLKEDKAAGEPYDAAELKRLLPLTKASLKEDRSHCLHCQHQLTGRDLIPLVSWLSTKGRCRYCKRPIGRFEPAIELLLAGSFVAYYHFWIMTGGSMLLPGLIIMLAALVMLAVLFAYDLKWFLLPDKVTYPLIGLSVVYAAYMAAVAAHPLSVLMNAAGGVLILGGLYLALWLVSKGRWVGFGDVKLGVALGLLLTDWKLAFLALFLANFIGTVIVIPGLVSGKLDRQTQVPFGPLLIGGFFISLVAGSAILGLYDDFSVWLTSVLLML